MSQMMNPWLLGAGIGGSMLGNLMQGVSTNRAGRQARDYYGQQTGQGAGRMSAALFGAPYMMDWVNAGMGDVGAAGRMNTAMGGSLADKSQAMIGTASGRQGMADYDADTSRLGRFGADQWNYLQGVMGNERAGLSDFFSRGAGTQLADFDRAAGGLRSTVAGYGAGQQAKIDRQANEETKAANQMAMSRLLASGFGNSTVAANMMAGNARTAQNRRQDRTADLNDAQIDRTVGLDRSLLSERSGLANSLFGSQGAMLQNMANSRMGMESNLSNNMVGREYDRARGRTALQDTGTARELSARGADISLFSNVLGSGVMNPMLGQNTMGYYPGVNPGAQAGFAGTNGLMSLLGMGYFG